MMQIVIDIPVDTYERVMNPDKFYRDIDGEKIRWAVYKGTILPKHGRLGDLDKLYKKTQNEENDTEEEKSMKALFRYLIRQADTILEATKIGGDKYE